MNNHFIVYSKSGCPSCVKAKQLIDMQGDSYTDTVIGVDISREEFMETFPNVRTVPYIIEQNAAPIGGFEKLVEWYQETNA